MTRFWGFYGRYPLFGPKAQKGGSSMTTEEKERTARERAVREKRKKGGVWPERKNAAFSGENQK